MPWPASEGTPLHVVMPSWIDVDDDRKDESPDPPEGPRSTALLRSATTLQCVLDSHLDGRTGLYGQRTRFGRRRHEALWPFVNAWSALSALVSVDPSPERKDLLRRCFQALSYYSGVGAVDGPTSGPVGFSSAPGPHRRRNPDIFFDDNAWVGLALLRHCRVTGDERALEVASRVLHYVLTGWSRDADWTSPGGIRWKPATSCRSRNTCSNGPTAELAASLFLLSGESHYLEQSLQIYRWVRDTLLTDHLYADKISPSGEVDGTIWSYNQGTMIGAATVLYQATGDSEFLTQATATARAAAARFSVSVLIGQEPAFNAIFFRNLAVLAESGVDVDFRALAAAYSASMWNERRDGRSGLFSGQGSAFNNSVAMVEVDATIAGAVADP
jgi:hypothetical protein